MKKYLFFLIFGISITNVTFTSCSKEDDYTNPERPESGSNNSENNDNNGNSGNSNDVMRVYLSSSYSFKKSDGGYYTGNATVQVQNSSSKDITSVIVILKSKNQSDKTIGKWNSISANGHEKSTDKITFNKIQYPYITCTYIFNGKSYSKEYTYK